MFFAYVTIERNISDSRQLRFYISGFPVNICEF